MKKSTTAFYKENCPSGDDDDVGQGEKEFVVQSQVFRPRDPRNLPSIDGSPRRGSELRKGWDTASVAMTNA